MKDAQDLCAGARQGETRLTDRELQTLRNQGNEAERAADEIESLREEVYFYRRRSEALQHWQSRMRDPERIIVCDILANGCTLPEEVAGSRYEVLPEELGCDTRKVREA